jgi:signal transduction histidine kinase
VVSSEVDELELGTHVRVPIPQTNLHLVATGVEAEAADTIERLHAVATTVSLVLRLMGREREAERTRFHVTLGRGVAGVVHDIANPLNALNLSLEAARDGIDVSDAIADALGATRLIGSALDRLRRCSGVLDSCYTSVDVGEAIAVALRIASFATRGLAEVVVRVAPSLKVWARAGELEHVIVNVLINAAQAIAGSAGGFHHRITVSAAVRGSDVVIEIHDTGPGIAAGDLGRLFDEGFTTKESRVGTGLGLSLCRDIVMNLGGSIEIASARDGTEVVIVLPSPDKGQQAHVLGEELENRARPRVLVVDGDDLVARALVRAIGAGATVTTTSSIDGALAKMKSTPFDLVLCEHRPPHVDGLRIQRESAEQHPEGANGVVLMLVDEATELPEGTRVIMKPLDLRVLRALLDARRLHSAVR